MIARLTGAIVHIGENTCIVDVHGVGYKVYVPQKVLASATVPSDITLFTHTHVREDLLELYGFSDQKEIQLFENLISVSGIGCKTALGVFALGTRSEIANAIAKADVAFFTGVPRLGKKNAQKLIVELKNKFGAGSEDLDLSTDDGLDDVITALQGFGFSLQEARKAVGAIHDKADTTEARLKLALKYLGR